MKLRVHFTSAQDSRNGPDEYPAGSKVTEVVTASDRPTGSLRVEQIVSGLKRIKVYGPGVWKSWEEVPE